MPGMPGIRPLNIMLRALGWAAVPAWPAGIASAVAWTGRAELACLSVAWAGTTSALVLRVLAWAQARMSARAAEYERLEGRLCGAVADLHPRGRDTAMTRPDLCVVPDLRIARLRRRGGAPARRAPGGR